MINLCVHGVPPTPVYKGGREEETGLGRRRVIGGANLLQVGLAPLSFPSSSSFPLLLLQLGKKGVLLPVGVGLPPGAPLLGSFIYGAGGHPRTHKLIFVIVP